MSTINSDDQVNEKSPGQGDYAYFQSSVSQVTVFVSIQKKFPFTHLFRPKAIAFSSKYDNFTLY